MDTVELVICAGPGGVGIFHYAEIGLLIVFFNIFPGFIGVDKLCNICPISKAMS